MAGLRRLSNLVSKPGLTFSVKRARLEFCIAYKDYASWEFEDGEEKEMGLVLY